MVQITVNQRELEAKSGETLLECMRRHGISVPTLCHIDGLPPSGACRMCVVEIEGMPNLAPSCAFPVHDGLRVMTHSPRVVEARKTIVELLLADHPDDCLFCPRSGNCRLQELAMELGVQRRYTGARTESELDVSSPSITRDPAKCILCGKCVRVCEEVQHVAAIDFVGRGSLTHIGTAFDEGLNISSCINCGQCVMVCPTGALTERNDIPDVIAALDDPDLHVVVQHAPSISVTLGEEFGLAPGTEVAGLMTAALRMIGFERVFDTGFAADLTIMEEGSELVHRLQNGGKLPMLTSCSPGWIKYVETFFPEFIENLSTCKSPQQMMGAVIKSFYAEREGIDPNKIFSVSIMPCTAKKYEAARPEMAHQGIQDVDAVLTTRELARLIQMRGIDFRHITPDTADTPFGERTSAGKLFGATGGVMEAAIRSAHFLATGSEMSDVKVEAVRGFDGLKQAKVNIGGVELGVAVVSGVGECEAVARRDSRRTR
jgi:iron-only hydrogenase group A